MKYVGIDIGGTNIVAGIVDDTEGKYTVLSVKKRKTNVDDGKDCIVKNIQQLYEDLLKKSNVNSNEINWVGVGVPGSVNRKSGVIGFSSNFNVTNWKIKEELENLLKKKVFVLNDADAYAYGEFVAGNVRKSNNALVLTLGTGIGCGIILNRELYSSSNFAAGEIGHMVIKYNGRQCNCGRKGCFEAYASATGLVRTAKEEVLKSENVENEYIYKISNGLKNLNAKMPFDAKKAGDKLGTKIVNLYISHLACGITNIVNIFQPDKICIGGGVSLQGEYLFKPLREHVDKYKYKVIPFEKVKIIGAKNCETAAIIGAVAIGKIM